MIELSATLYEDLEEIWLQELKPLDIDYVDIAVQYREKHKVGLKKSKIACQTA